MLTGLLSRDNVTRFAAFDPTTAINVALSNSNLTGTHTGGTNSGGVRVARFISSGKYYWECRLDVAASSSDCIGFMNAAGLVTDANTVNNIIVLLAAATDLLANNVSAGLNFGARTTGDNWGIAIDLTAGLVWFRRNGGSWNTNGSADPATGVGGVSFTLGAYAPYIRFATVANGEVMTADFGASAYSNPAPSGFINWPA